MKLLKYWWNNHKTSFLLIIVLIVYFLIEITYWVLTPDVSKFQSSFYQLIMPVIALLAIILGWRQIEANHDWNRRSLTTTEVYKYINNLREYRMKLDEISLAHQVIKINDRPVSFTDRVTFYRTNEDEVLPLSPDEFHNWICAKNGNEIDNIKDSSGNEICKTTKEGELIVHYVLLIINTYEHIATAVKNNVFDKELILDLLENSIYQNYKFFEPYIKHRRNKHKATNFAINLEYLASQIEKKNKSIRSKSEQERPPTSS